MCLGELLLEFLHVQVVCMCVPGRAVCRSFSTLRLFCMTVRMSIGVYFSLFSFIVHPGIDGVLTYFFKKSTVWRPFDLKLPNVGQVITSHGFTFVRFVSMETAFTFDPKCFSVFLTSSTVSYIYYVSFFFITPMVEYHNSML